MAAEPIEIIPDATVPLDPGCRVVGPRTFAVHPDHADRARKFALKVPFFYDMVRQSLDWFRAVTMMPTGPIGRPGRAPLRWASGPSAVGQAVTTDMLREQLGDVGDGGLVRFTGEGGISQEFQRTDAHKSGLDL